MSEAKRIDNRFEVFRVLRDKAPRFFTVDDALLSWEEHGTQKRISRRGMQMTLSRLSTSDGLIRRQARGVYEVRR